MYSSLRGRLGRLPLVVHADDVRVVELRERLRLAAGVGRDLERDQPLHRLLPREKHAGERAAAQRREQLKVVERVARLAGWRTAASRRAAAWAAPWLARRRSCRRSRSPSASPTAPCRPAAATAPRPARETARTTSSLIHRPPGRHAGLQLLVDHVDRQLADRPEQRVAAGRTTRSCCGWRLCCQRRSMSSFDQLEQHLPGGGGVEIGDEIASSRGGSASAASAASQAAAKASIRSANQVPRRLVALGSARARS